MNTPEVPDLSERTKTWMGRFGPAEPLSAAMAGSFQVVILPLKILASVAPDSFRPVIPGRLYWTEIAPAISGMETKDPYLSFSCCTSAAAAGTSEPAKSTVPAMSWARPAPEPTPV